MESFLAGETVRERLVALSASLRSLAAAFDVPSDWPAVIARHEHGHLPSVASGAAAFQLAGAAFRHLDFEDDQDERRVVRFVGAVAVTSAVLRKAEMVNEHKRALLEAIGTYRRLASRRARDSHHVRDLLIRLGYARLNLVQTYRKVPILSRAPTRIGFSWILGTNRVETINREGAMRRLPDDIERSGEDLSRISREVFEASRNELRLVRRVAPHVRANICWYEGDERQTACIHAPLPVLYAFSARTPEPEVAGHDRPEPDPQTVRPRQKRSDAHLRRIHGTIDVYRTS